LKTGEGMREVIKNTEMGCEKGNVKDGAHLSIHGGKAKIAIFFAQGSGSGNKGGKSAAVHMVDIRQVHHDFNLFEADTIVEAFLKFAYRVRNNGSLDNDDFDITLLPHNDIQTASSS